MANMTIGLRSLYQKARLGRMSQTCSCLVFLGLLAGEGSCHGGRHSFAETKMPVKIDVNCNPSVDPIVIYPGNTVTWSFEKNVYDLSFEPKIDPNPVDNGDDITPDDPVMSADKKSATWLAAKDTPLDCSFDSKGNEAGCYFKYNIYRVATAGQEILCYDPGVHVIPTGNLETSNN